MDIRLLKKVGSGRKEERRSKVFQYCELAKYYKVSPRVVSRVVGEESLKTLGSVVRVIRELDRRYGKDG